jgi:hypothetical protein
MGKKRCIACGALFQARPQVPHQSYCSALACQRERRQEWQRRKLQIDPDHRDNKTRAHQAWSARNPDYWRQYRENHPDYAARNRSMQRERNAASMSRTIAKMDVSTLKFSLQSGVYQLKLLPPGAVAKMDVWTVEITKHTCVDAGIPGDCKDRM